MPARAVLRKRIKFDDRVRNADGSFSEEFVRDLVRHRNEAINNGKDVSDSLTADIRRSANLAPHLLESEMGSQAEPEDYKKQYPKVAPETKTQSQEADPATTDAEGSGDNQTLRSVSTTPMPEFLTTWGLVLRNNPREPGTKDPKTGTVTHEWLDGFDPQTVRRNLLQPGDVLTEITEGEGVGDLPTQAVFTDEERRSVAIDTALEAAQYNNASQHWGTRKSGGTTFGTARDAMRLIGTNWSQTGFDAPAGQDGENINVVIVDTGFNENYLRSLVPDVAFGGGFIVNTPNTPFPGDFQSAYKSMPTGHGNMIARNILRIAPRVRLFDAPILPPRVTDVQEYTFMVELLFEAIQELRSLTPYAHQPWLIVNAWAVADSIQERGLGPQNMLYTTGEFHNTNTLLQLMSQDYGIVFAAGNNGLFEPAPGSGHYNRGPHRPGGNPPIENGRPFGSITGANALPGVLTTGACTTNGAWIASSSQGDGPQSLRTIDNAAPGFKPDLVAPSWFSENQDSHQINTGTSASSAVVAGLAASAWGADPNLSPQELFTSLRNAALSAENENAIGYRARFGHGIVQYPLNLTS